MNRLTIKTRKGAAVSTAVLLGLGAYAQGAAAIDVGGIFVPATNCGTIPAYQTLYVPSSFYGVVLQSGSYWNSLAFGANTCTHFVVDFKVNINSNIENTWAQPVEFGAWGQNDNSPDGPNATQSSCPNYRLHRKFYRKLAGAGAFTYLDFASYKGVWRMPVEFFAAHCAWQVTKAPSIDWQSQLATSGNWDTYRVAARMMYQSPVSAFTSFNAVKVNVSHLPAIPE